MQQQQQELLKQQLLVAQGLPVEPPTFKTDPRFLSWIGGSVIPKLDSSKEMYVTRDKYMAAFMNYDRHFEESKAEAVLTLQTTILEQRQAALKQK